MLGGWPSALVALRVLLAFFLDVAHSLAPTQTVSNVRFEDTNTDGGWLSGTVRWDPPGDTTGIKNYAILIFNTMSDVTPTLPSLPGDFDGAWFLTDLGGKPDALVGTNEFKIRTLFDPNGKFPRRGSGGVQPTNRTPYVWGRVNYPDRYLAVAVVNDQKENGPVTVIPIYDKSTQLPNPHLLTATFTDTAPYAGVILGKVKWTISDESDFTLTKSYAVFLANDEKGTNEIQVGSAALLTTELFISGYRANRDWILIRGVNPNGVSKWSLNTRIFDLGPEAPNKGVTALAFTDTDPRQGFVAGNVTWKPPEDEATIQSYKIFLSDQPGVGGIVSPKEGYTVPVGTNFFLLPASELRNAAEAGDPDYLQVYAANDKGMNARPAELAIQDLVDV